MPQLVGWLGFQLPDRTNAIDVLERMAGATTLATFVSADNQAAFGVTDGDGSFYCEHDDVVVVLCSTGTLHGTSLSILNQPAQELARMYRQEGEDAIKQLGGAFSVAIYDGKSRTATIGIDRIGINTIAYFSDRPTLVFGTKVKSVLSHPCTTTDVSLQSIFNYVYFHTIPAPQSAFSAIGKLLPGSSITYSNQRLDVRKYWIPEFHENRRRPFPELKQEFRALLEQSINRVSRGENVGAFLSGGTDSSTVTGQLGLVTGKSPNTFSIGFSAADYDETSYARIAAEHFHANHHEYSVTPDDIFESIPLVASAYDEPFGNSSAVAAYFCAKLAYEHGVRRLLGGDGGDELFGGNTRYSKQWIYSLYDKPPAFFRYVLEGVLRSIPSAEWITPLRKLRSYVTQASIPMPARMMSYNLLTRIGVCEVFTREFLNNTDQNQPLTLLEQTYWEVSAESMTNRMLGLDFKFTLADNDLPKVTNMCELAGLEAVFPLLDDDLVDFAAELPPDLKLRGTQLRYFFKRALQDFLPPQIISKSKHGFGLPFGVWLHCHKGLRELAFDSLLGLGKRDIVNSRFIDKLLSEKLGAHPDYYGTMVWVLMMLELWFVGQSN